MLNASPLSPTAQPKFQGVILTRQKNENWQAKLVDSAHPDVGGDEILILDETKSRDRAATTTNTMALRLQSKRVLWELTRAFRLGELQADALPKILTDILKNGDYHAKGGAKSTSYYDPVSGSALDNVTDQIRPAIVARYTQDRLPHILNSLSGDASDVSIEQGTEKRHKTTWYGRQKTTYQGDSLVLQSTPKPIETDTSLTEEEFLDRMKKLLGDSFEEIQAHFQNAQQQQAATSPEADKIAQLRATLPTLDQFIPTLAEPLQAEDQRKALTQLVESVKQPERLLKELKIFISQVQKMPDVKQALEANNQMALLYDVRADLERHVQKRHASRNG